MSITNILSKYKAIFIIIVIILLLVIGFFIGRSTKKGETKVVTEYVKGETIRDTVYKSKPYIVKAPADTADIIRQCVRDGIYAELFPERIKYIEIEPEREDTTAIMKDWASVRKYNETLFDDDTLGVCNVDVTVQYNRMSSVSYDFTPVNKITTVEKQTIKRFSPYIGAGISLYPSASVEGGMYFNDKWGVGIEGTWYVLNTDSNKHSVGVKVLRKF